MALSRLLTAIGIVQPKWADFLGDTQEAAITATGTNQSGAYQLSKNINEITTCDAGVNDGVKLPLISGTAYSIFYIRNSSAEDAKVYPASGNGIGSAAPLNDPITLAAGTGAVFAVITSTVWIQI